jgi:citrate synthase
MDLRKIKVADADFGLMTYDPAFMNTASCKSRITFIDGDLGILRYRGYPIEQLAERSNFLEVAYLTLHGELPTAAELQDFSWNITHHTFIHENIKNLHGRLPLRRTPDGHVGQHRRRALDLLPDAKNIFDKPSRAASRFTG